MKASTTFEKIVYAHLESIAEKDPLFAETFKKPNKNITECVSYICQTVQKSGMNGVADEEVFAMAVHYYDEDSIKDIKPINAKVIVNHSIAADKSKASSQAPVKSVSKPAAKKQVPVAQMPLF